MNFASQKLFELKRLFELIRALSQLTISELLNALLYGHENSVPASFLFFLLQNYFLNMISLIHFNLFFNLFS